jgi:hypothetical protein
MFQHIAPQILASLAAAWTLLLVSAPEPATVTREDAPVQVFLLVGQSNMEGKGKLDHLRQLATDPETSDTYGHWLKPDGSWVVREDVWIWYMGKAGGLGVGYGTPEDRFGPELQIGHVLGEAIDAPVLLIKIAWGGKSLAVDFRPPSAGGEVGPFYSEVLTHTREVLADLGAVTPKLAGREHELKGLIWFQGWNDRVNQEHNDAYEENLAHLIRDLRKDLQDPDLPFVVGETGQGGVNETHPRALSLMKAQATVAQYEEFRGNVAFVGTKLFYDEEPRHDGGYHFFGNAANFFRIGHALGQGMLELREFSVRLRITRSQILMIAEGVRSYSVFNAGKYPPTLVPLVTPDAEGRSFLPLDEVPRDPWGNEYVYTPPAGEQPYEILSLGADGRPGGKGAAADIKLSETKAR